MYEQIHARIEVTAIFTPHRLKIEKFTWEGRDYIINQINLVTKARKGRELVWLYYVSNDNAAYKLRYDTESLIWWLEEITWEEPTDQS